MQNILLTIHLTSAQKKQYMNDIGIIEKAVQARTELTQKID